MEELRVEEIVEATETANDVAECIVKESGMSVGKKVAIVGAVVLTAAGVYIAAKFYKAKKTKKNGDIDYVDADTSLDEEVDETE